MSGRFSRSSMSRFSRSSTAEMEDFEIQVPMVVDGKLKMVTRNASSAGIDLKPMSRDSESQSLAAAEVPMSPLRERSAEPMSPLKRSDKEVGVLELHVQSAEGLSAADKNCSADPHEANELLAVGRQATEADAEFEFVVPEGALPGGEVQIVTSDGLLVCAALPAGAAPGAKCAVVMPRIEPSEPTVLAAPTGGKAYEVTVPHFAKPGGTLRAVRAHGLKDVLVEVPTGAKAGSVLSFDVEWPV